MSLQRPRLRTAFIGLSLGALLLSGCVSVPSVPIPFTKKKEKEPEVEQSYTLEEKEVKIVDTLVIKNRAQTVINNITVHVKGSDQTVSTNLVLRNQDFNLELPKSLRSAEGAELSWLQSGVRYTEDISEAIPKNFSNQDAVYKAVVLIMDDGEFVAYKK